MLKSFRNAANTQSRITGMGDGGGRNGGRPSQVASHSLIFPFLTPPALKNVARRLTCRESAGSSCKTGV